MHIRLKLAVLFGAIAGALMFGGLAAAHTPTVVPGAPCVHIGAQGIHGSETYRCEQHAGESCPHFHWIYNPGVPKSGQTAWPLPTCPCTSATPTASPTVGPTPSHTPAVAPSPTGTVATATPTPTRTASSPTGTAATTTAASSGELPVTGPHSLALFGFGLLLAVAGVTLLLVGYLRRHRDV